MRGVSFTTNMAITPEAHVEENKRRLFASGINISRMCTIQDVIINGKDLTVTVMELKSCQDSVRAARR